MQASERMAYNPKHCSTALTDFKFAMSSKQWVLNNNCQCFYNAKTIQALSISKLTFTNDFDDSRPCRTEHSVVTSNNDNNNTQSWQKLMN